MRTDEITIMLFCIFLVVLVFGSIIALEVNDLIICKSYKKKYPQLFNLIDEKEKLSDCGCKHYAERILPLKNKIDYTLEQQKYMTKISVKISNDELESVRKQIEILEQQSLEIQEQENELQAKIEEMIRADKKLLKYMRKLGWCKDD